MAELVTVARPYAKAAFTFAQEKSASEAKAFAEWSAMLGFAAAVMSDKAVAKALDNPQLTADKKAELFIKICGDKLNSAGKQFVHQLAQNKRLKALPQVSVLFEKLLAEQQRKQEVQVASAYPLSAAEQESLKKTLAKKLGKEVNLQSEVDKALIGGVIIRAGDMVIDSSVRGKLQQLSHVLK
jgi:F-type H+-transporting ATPase subunit delta